MKPKKPLTESMSFRFPVALKRKLERLALADGRTVTSYAAKVLAEHVSKQRGR